MVLIYAHQLSKFTGTFSCSANLKFGVKDNKVYKHNYSLLTNFSQNCVCCQWKATVMNANEIYLYDRQRGVRRRCTTFNWTKLLSK